MDEGSCNELVLGIDVSMREEREEEGKRKDGKKQLPVSLMSHNIIS